jgi:hypothetical protein
MGVIKRWWWVGALLLGAVGLIVYTLVGASPKAGPSQSTVAETTSAVAAANGPTSSAQSAASMSAAQPSSKSPVAPKKSSASKSAAVIVVPKGAKLATVTTPPPDTLAQIRYSAARDGQTYDVVVRPYGTGPVRAGHGTVVVAIDSSKAQKSYQQPVDLNGVNALLEPGPKIQGAVAVGGTYSGVVRLLRRGDVLVLELVSAKRQ